jgi:hypothetical protein
MTKDEGLRLAIESLCCVRDMVGNPDNLEYIDHQIAKIEAALEAKDEPMHPDIKKLYEDYFDKCFRESSPPQRTWVGLTDMDIALIDWESLVTRKDCVRAIEAKLKEKNT